MMRADTKKDVHTAVEIHYNECRHEPTPRGGGLARVAGQSCLAGPSVLQLHLCSRRGPDKPYGTGTARGESTLF
jgi:hypothetical protein